MDEPQTPAERRTAMRWARRLKRVFHIDIETGGVWGGAVKVIACIEDPVVIEKIVVHLSAKAETTAHTRLPESRTPSGGLFD